VSEGAPDSPAEAPHPSRRSTRRRVLRWLAGIGAVVVILLALLVGTMRVAMTHLPEYRGQIQAWVNDTSHLDVRFKTMDARWRIYGPELFVTDVQVRAPKGGPLLAKARAASIGYDMWRALLHAEVMPARITLIRPEIGVVRTPDGRIELEGQAALEDREQRFKIDDLPTGLVRVEDAKVTFTDQQGKLRDLILTGVEAGLRRDRDDLELEAELDLPDRMGSRFAFNGEAHGDLAVPEVLSWHADVGASDVDLRGWHEFLGSSLNIPNAGHGQVRLSVGANGAQLTGGALQLQLTDVVLPASHAWPSETRYTTLSGDVRLDRKEGVWRLTGRNVRLVTASQGWEPTRLSASWTQNDDGLASLEAQMGYARLENLVPFAALAPESQWRNRLTELLPEGELRSIKLSYTPGDAAHVRYQASAQFDDLGFAPVGEAPGLRGLRGQLSASDASGRATLDSHAVVFSMPHKFRGPLSADVARGEVLWEHSQAGWHISTRQFAVRNAHANAETDLDLTLPGGDSSPILKLHSRFRDAVLTEAWRYLPTDKLPDKVLAWLDAMPLAGRAPSGEFVFDGATRNFPFRDGSGEFRISFPVEGMRMHYAPGWPDIENLSADIEFKNAGLTGIVHSAQLNGLKVTNSKAQFLDFRNGELTIDGHAVGDLGDALGYLQKTPVVDSLGSMFADLRGKGPVTAKVNLLLPVKDMDQRKVLVTTDIHEATLQLANTKHTLEELEGVLEVKDRFVSANDLTAKYLGGPVHVDLTPEVLSGRKQLDNVIHVRAQTPLAALRRDFDVPDVVDVDGTLDWRGTMRIPSDGGDDSAPRRPLTLRINSSLRGAAVNLPEPLTKAAGDIRPLRVDVQWPDSSNALVRANYGNDVRSQLNFRRDDFGWAFDRGGVRLGESDARLPLGKGLEVHGNVARLDLSQWLALHADGNTPADASRRPLSDYLRSVELTIGDFHVFGMQFPQVNGSLVAGDKAWSVSVDGPKAHGIVVVPFEFASDDPLTIDMTRMTLDSMEEESAPEEGSDTQSDPKQWPNVKASIGDFTAFGKHLGSASAELKRIPDGLSLDSFTAKSPSHELTASGTWTNPSTGQRGSLKLKLDSTDLKQTLQDLGYGPGLAAKHGVVSADVSFPGAPSSTLLGRLNGTVRVDVENGQLLTVQPGAGRVFGLLSIATLPRRLSLDFSDLTDKGFAFDSIRGDFTLENGDAYTKNLLLKGPAAEIGMVGRTGLASHEYDQTVVVTGSFGNALPAAGLLAGGPAIGAAMLLFSQIFKEPLKGIARGYYRITGPWENPIVQRIESSDAKKTENALHVVEKKKEKG
jgi:uncharacterized protein (TIGR02099 family)